MALKLSEINHACPSRVRHTYDVLEANFGRKPFEHHEAVTAVTSTLGGTEKAAEDRIKDVRKWGGLYT